MKPPHLLVSSVGIQWAAIGGRDDKRQRVRAAAVVHIFEAVAQLGMRLKVVQQTRVGIHAGEAQPQKGANENYTQ